MSLSDFILGLTLVLKDHVDDNTISEKTMLDILNKSLSNTKLNIDNIDRININNIPIANGLNYYHNNINLIGINNKIEECKNKVSFSSSSSNYNI